MADPINLPDAGDGQSIPPALAAPRKPRGKTVKAADPVAATPRPAKVKPPKAAPPVVAAPAPVAEIATPDLLPEPAPEPEIQSAPEPEPVAAAVSEPEPVVAAAPESEAVVPEPLVEPDPVSTPTAAVTAEPRKESIMATTIENVTAQTSANTAKAQAFFADASERTKGAVAKTTKLFEDAAAFNKGNVEALVESSKIAAKAFETMGQDVAEYGRKSFEEASAAFKTLATVKSPTEFLKLHSDYVRQSFDSLVAETSRSTEQALKLAGEVAQPISNRFAVAAEKIKTAA